MRWNPRWLFLSVLLIAIMMAVVFLVGVEVGYKRGHALSDAAGMNSLRVSALSTYRGSDSAKVVRSLSLSVIDAANAEIERLRLEGAFSVLPLSVSERRALNEIAPMIKDTDEILHFHLRESTNEDRRGLMALAEYLRTKEVPGSPESDKLTPLAVPPPPSPK
jgi:hypothetical protein